MFYNKKIPFQGKQLFFFLFFFFFFFIFTFIFLKEIISQSDLYLVNLSSKTYVFEDKLTKYKSV